MIEWKDVTSYRQGERGKTSPRSLETTVNGLRITIHRHKDYENTWLLTCYKLNMEQINLETNDIKDAEKIAIRLIIDKINSFVEIKDKLLHLTNL